MGKLKDIRIAAGLTQKQLAEMSGVNIRQIGRYESGTSDMSNATLSNALAIAKALNVEPRDLMEEGEMLGE